MLALSCGVLVWIDVAEAKRWKSETELCFLSLGCLVWLFASGVEVVEETVSTKKKLFLLLTVFNSMNYYACAGKLIMFGG